jgi:SAM-dependent methyltransferase
MLTRARTHEIPLAAAKLPDLPFRDSVFDIATANLVLSHLADYEAGLAEIVRVLGRGGRIGCSAWGPDVPSGDENQAGQADAIVEELVREHGLDVTPPTPAVPSEEPLRDRAHLDAVLRGAGLVDTRVDGHTYQWRSTVKEFVVGRAWRPRSRYIRQQASSRLWDEIQARAAVEVRRRLGEEVRSTGAVWIAVGTKP